MDTMKHLSEKDAGSLLRAIHTGHVPTIIQTMLSLDQLSVTLKYEVQNPPAINYISTTSITKHFQDGASAQDLHYCGISDSPLSELCESKAIARLTSQHYADCLHSEQKLSQKNGVPEELCSRSHRELPTPMNICMRKETSYVHTHPGLCATTDQNNNQLDPSPAKNRYGSSKKIKNAPVEVYPSRRPKKCKLCYKSVRADNFKVHMRSHTGEKPYHCPKCPFKTANPSSLPKHLLIHEKEAKTYKCPNCSYRTIYRSNIAAHQRKHNS